jgi:hypothetical protein
MGTLPTLMFKFVIPGLALRQNPEPMPEKYQKFSPNFNFA